MYVSWHGGTRRVNCFQNITFHHIRLLLLSLSKVRECFYEHDTANGDSSLQPVQPSGLLAEYGGCTVAYHSFLLVCSSWTESVESAVKSSPTLTLASTRLRNFYRSSYIQEIETYNLTRGTMIRVRIYARLCKRHIITIVVDRNAGE